MRAELPDIRSQLPEGMLVELPYDASEFIDSSIKEVIKTLGEAVIIVLLVIFSDIRLPAGSHCSIHRRTAIADWRRTDHVDAGLLPQPADTAGNGAGHWAGGG